MARRSFFAHIKHAAKAASTFAAAALDESLAMDRARSLFGTTLNNGAPQRGSRELLELFNTSSLLRMVEGRIADRCASLTWRLKAPTRDSARAERRASPWLRRAKAMPFAQRQKLLTKMTEQGDLREIERHPLLDLLYAPNPDMTGFGFLRLHHLYLDILGESPWALTYNEAGAPTGAYPIPPFWIRELPTPRAPFYVIEPPNAVKPLEVPVDDLLLFRDLNPTDPYWRGSGLGRAIADELETDEYAARHVKAFFFNGARPDLLIYAPGLTPEQTKPIERAWLDKVQGFWRKHLPYFASLPGNVQIKEFTQDFGSLNVEALRTAERDRVVQFFGVPPEILGINATSNRATSEVADYLFDKNLVIPRAEASRITLQVRLLPRYDERLILDYDSPLQGDADREAAAVAVAPWAFYLDEHRQRAGKEPIGGDLGKIRMVPAGLVPTTDEALLAEAIAAADPPAPPPIPGAPAGGAGTTPGANPDDPAQSTGEKPEDSAGAAAAGKGMELAEPWQVRR